ncbi:hypothetical protein ACFWVC_15375 [Streptomyces sp. NPDC058691]|uniref:hypothetical protein n=1 Tax=Streptomyces sp. NPDC058691 TaxID=3346601 RepID=UPI003661BE87
MDEVRLAWADRPGNWWRRNWFFAGCSAFGVGQAVVVGSFWPGALFPLGFGLIMIGERIVARRLWVAVDAEGIRWCGGFRGQRQLGWSEVGHVGDRSTIKRSILVRSMRVTGRDGVVHRLPLPYSTSFFDPDADFDRKAALIMDLARRYLDRRV